MPKVSVIVPVYNVEKYIERCVRSLMEQTLEDMEFIFVDDCSPDNSIAIVNNVLKEYPNRNSKVLYNTSNKGPSYTRARGYYESTGDFIIYCDSDDWVDNNMYPQIRNN